MINNESLSERQSISKGETFGETIDKGALSERQSINKGDTFGETIDEGELSGRQSINKVALSEILNNTSKVLLMVLLLLVNYCWLSHIHYAFYLFLS